MTSPCSRPDDDNDDDDEYNDDYNDDTDLWSSLLLPSAGGHPRGTAGPGETAGRRAGSLQVQGTAVSRGRFNTSLSLSIYALSFLCVVFNQKLNKIGLTPKIVHRSTAKYRGCAGVARYAISLHTNSSLTMQFNLQTIFAGTQNTHINFHILIICNKIATKIFENHLTQYNYCWHTCSKSWSL